MFATIVGGLLILLVAILLFGFTIFVHELGHFLVARACGMVVDVFSIGFGHSIWKKEINGITYKIGWIPLGGYVALPQMEPATEERREKDEKTIEERALTGDEPVQRTADELPPIEPWKKILVAVAGAVGNIIFAILLSWIIYLSPSAATGEGSTDVGHVATNVPAYAEGLRPGDRIASVNGKAVHSWYEFRVETMLSAGSTETAELVVERPNGETFTFTVPTEKDEMKSQTVPGISESSKCFVTEVFADRPAAAAGFLEGDEMLDVNGVPVAGTQHFINLVANSGGVPLNITIRRNEAPMLLQVTPYAMQDGDRERWVIGVGIASVQEKIFPWMRYKDPWKQLSHDATSIFRILSALTNPKEAKAAAQGMGGPLAIISMLWLAVQMGVMSAFGFIRFLNVNLAILNLMPIPILDGGHIMFALYEIVMRRKVPARVVHTLVNVFFVILICVFLTLTVKDVGMLRKLFKKPVETEQVEAPPAPGPVEQEPAPQQVDLPAAP